MATTTQQIEILEYISDFSVYKNVFEDDERMGSTAREREAGGPTAYSSQSLKTVTRGFSSCGRGRLWGGVVVVIIRLVCESVVDWAKPTTDETTSS